MLSSVSLVSKVTPSDPLLKVRPLHIKKYQVLIARLGIRERVGQLYNFVKADTRRSIDRVETSEDESR